MKHYLEFCWCLFPPISASSFFWTQLGFLPFWIVEHHPVTVISAYIWRYICVCVYVCVFGDTCIFILWLKWVLLATVQFYVSEQPPFCSSGWQTCRCGNFYESSYSICQPSASLCHSASKSCSLHCRVMLLNGWNSDLSCCLYPAVCQGSFVRLVCMLWRIGNREIFQYVLPSLMSPFLQKLLEISSTIGDCAFMSHSPLYSCSLCPVTPSLLYFSPLHSITTFCSLNQVGVFIQHLLPPMLCTRKLPDLLLDFCLCKISVAPVPTWLNSSEC